MGAKERAEALAVEAVHPKAKAPKADPQGVTLEALTGIVLQQGERLDKLIALMAANVKAPKGKAKASKVSTPKVESPGDAALKPFRNVLQHPTTGVKTLGNLAFSVLMYNDKTAVFLHDGKGSIVGARAIAETLGANVRVKPYAGEPVDRATRWLRDEARFQDYDAGKLPSGVVLKSK